MKKILSSLFLLVMAIVCLQAKALSTNTEVDALQVALSEAHWGFEADEATSLVGQYNGTDRFVAQDWTSNNAYLSASTQHKPYIVTNANNVYAYEGTQALHIEGTSTYNMPYVILPKISGVENYDGLVLSFYVRNGYWSDFGMGEGMWSNANAANLKVGSVNAIPEREDFASSVVMHWDTTFTAVGFFDPFTANTWTKVSIPMHDCSDYMVIYSECTVNTYICIDNVVIENADAAAPTTYNITYNLTGCVGSVNEDNNPNPTTIGEDEDDLHFYFELTEGYTWEGALITVMHGEDEIGDCMVTYDFDNAYIWEASEGWLNVWLEDGFSADLTITITCPRELVFPAEFTPATFEDVTVGENGVYYNPTLVNGVNPWLDGSFKFVTYYSNGYGDYYSDIVVSSLCNPALTADYNNPVSYLSAACDHTAEGNNFAVWNQNFYGNSRIQLAGKQIVSGMEVNNTSAVVNYLSDAYTTFPADGYYMLQVTGYDNGVQTGTVNHYLVDWRDVNNKFTQTEWLWLDLTSLGEVDELSFDVYSDDANAWGLLIPAYFCFDNLGGEARPAEPEEITLPDTFSPANFEDVTIDAENEVYRPETFQVGHNWWLSGGMMFNTEIADWGDYGMGYMEAQVVNYAGGFVPADFSDAYLATAAQGAAEGSNYISFNIGYADQHIQLVNTVLSGVAVTNTKYVVSAITEGMYPARKFEQGDWLKLTFIGWNGEQQTGTVDFYLADFRGESEWFYAEDWQWVDLTSLGEINGLSLAISGSDMGDWGLNTPAYVCLDNFGGQASECALGEMTIIRNTNGVENINSDTLGNDVQKFVIEGQLFIRRGEHIYNAAGQLIR